MIWSLGVAAVVAQTVGVLTYREVPAAVEQVLCYEWHEGQAPIEMPLVVAREAADVTIRTGPSASVVAMFIRADGAYLIDGPFAWSGISAERTIDPRWRRSAVIDARRAPMNNRVEWLSASGDGGAWPQCVRTEGRVTCLGVLLEGSGVALEVAGDRLWWSIVTATATPFRADHWGRLLQVRGVSPETSMPVKPHSGIRAAIQSPVASPQRMRNVRLETADVPGATSVSVSPGALWISGKDVPERAWVEVRGPRAGPSYLPLRDLADGPPSLPVPVTLEEARSVDGSVLGEDDVPAAGAVVTVFRVIERIRGTARERDPPARVFVAEAISDDRGLFRVEGLGRAEYEVVAWHPQFGRASVALTESASRVAVHLESSGMVRGRVVIAGKPAGGVAVIGVPGPEAVRVAEDLLDVKGGETQTTADGRFMVFAAAGGGELRVGGGGYPVKRIDVPRGALRSIDLGDIELGVPIAIWAVLNDDPECTVRATGPVGRTGLQVVRGSRTAPGIFTVMIPEPGLWEFGLACGDAERGLSPALKEIGPDLSGKEVHFIVR